MPVNLNQYRRMIGVFNSLLHCRNIYINISIMFLLFSKSFCFAILLRKNIKIMNIILLRIFHIYALVTYVFHLWLYLTLTKRSGDIEHNPGPNFNSSQRFSICHWNLNNIAAHNFIKLTLPHTNCMLYVYQKPILTPVF